MLHTVNQSAFTSCLLEQCFTSAVGGDDILLLGDAVYGALDSSPCADRIDARSTECGIYLLREDAEKRGLKGQVVEAVHFADMPGFVALTAKHPHCWSWY